MQVLCRELPAHYYFDLFVYLHDYSFYWGIIWFCIYIHSRQGQFEVASPSAGMLLDMGQNLQETPAGMGRTYKSLNGLKLCFQLWGCKAIGAQNISNEYIMFQ